jgi:hypothetical protein
MKMLIGLFVVVAAAPGCGQECSRDAREGTYLMEFETVSGDCGPQNSTLSDSSDPVPSECVVTKEEWSGDECQQTTHRTCTLTADDMRVEGIVIIEQEDSDGEVFTGTTTMTIRRISDGSFVCQGTYNVTYTRQ